MDQSPRVYLKLSHIFCPDGGKAASTPSQDGVLNAERQAQSYWFAAIAALESLLLRLNIRQGICLAGPIPVLSHPDIIAEFYSAIVAPQAWQRFLSLPQVISEGSVCLPPLMPEFPLFPQDPLAQEQFCLVLTEYFALVMLVGEDAQGLPSFYFSFAPDQVMAAWSTLYSRLKPLHNHHVSKLESLLEDFLPPIPDYQLVTEFSRALLQHLPPVASPVAPIPVTRWVASPTAPSADVELIQALTHEIRTPLTSIRTMARLLLKRKDLSPDVHKRVQAIDQECTEQISRMELIFRATELETSPGIDHHSLVSTSLDQVFQQSIPRWQAQAHRHQVELTVELPSTLPQVVSNPVMLDQVLTGLIEKFVRSLPSGGAINLQVGIAGHQLKVQVHVQSSYEVNPLKTLGNLLLFQPETGRLSLNLKVTKNLFQSIGGKLTLRRRSPKEEVLTLYLPLGTASVH